MYVCIFIRVYINTHIYKYKQKIYTHIYINKKIYKYMKVGHYNMHLYNQNFIIFA